MRQCDTSSLSCILQSRVETVSPEAACKPVVEERASRKISHSVCVVGSFFEEFTVSRPADAHRTFLIATASAMARRLALTQVRNDLGWIDDVGYALSGSYQGLAVSAAWAIFQSRCQEWWEPRIHLDAPDTDADEGAEKS